MYLHSSDYIIVSACMFSRSVTEEINSHSFFLFCVEAVAVGSSSLLTHWGFLPGGPPSTTHTHPDSKCTFWPHTHLGCISCTISVWYNDNKIKNHSIEWSLFCDPWGLTWQQAGRVSSECSSQQDLSFVADVVHVCVFLWALPGLLQSAIMVLADLGRKITSALRSLSNATIINEEVGRTAWH